MDSGHYTLNRENILQVIRYVDWQTEEWVLTKKKKQKKNQKQNKKTPTKTTKNCWINVKPVCSSTTRFRWIQDTQSSIGTSWSLDDIYVGESCPELCHSRGTCLNGKCFCERGYFGNPECHRIFLIDICIHIRNVRFCTCKILVVDIRLCYYYYIWLFLREVVSPASWKFDKNNLRFLWGRYILLLLGVDIGGRYWLWLRRLASFCTWQDALL